MKYAGALSRSDAARPNTRRVIGIGELVVSDDPSATIATHAIGSCIAVCVFDPVALVAGMLHFLLPESSINPARAEQQPAAFADTGIPLLFQTASEYGLSRKRAIVKLVGGAEFGGSTGAVFPTGHRNALAARHLLWRIGVFIAAEDLGGTQARTLHLLVADGRLQIFSGQAFKEL